MVNSGLIKGVGMVFLICFFLISYWPVPVNAAYIQHLRTLEYSGEDHENSTGDYCDLKFSQGPWDTSSIDIIEENYNDIYLYARCRCWNDNNWTGTPPVDPTDWHGTTILQFDVWFYYNDPDCEGSPVDYYNDNIIRSNNMYYRAKKMTPYYNFQNVQEGDDLTIKWELNLVARTQDNTTIMDSTYTQTTVTIHVI